MPHAHLLPQPHMDHKGHTPPGAGGRETEFTKCTSQGAEQGLDESTVKPEGKHGLHGILRTSEGQNGAVGGRQGE